MSPIHLASLRTNRNRSASPQHPQIEDIRWGIEHDIRAWIETWNENPQPFVWTKTADQILESISRYCTRTNLTAH